MMKALRSASMKATILPSASTSSKLTRYFPDEGMGTVHGRVEAHHGRRDERAGFFGLHVDEFTEFDATVDSFIWLLQPGMESQYLQEITQFAVAHNHRIRTDEEEAGLFIFSSIHRRSSLQSSTSFAAPSFS